MKPLEETIRNYIEAYNSFDIERMLSLFSKDCVFENLSNSSEPMTIRGIEALEQQARMAAGLFKERQQKVVDKYVVKDKAAVRIEYTAVLKSDLPNGMKAGQTLKLHGVSFFEFDGDKIKKLTDFS